MIVALAMVAGGVGAVARYGLSGSVQRAIRTTRPWGTAAVNLTGALALGLIIGLRDGSILSADAVSIAGIGFLGGFTTFSTWAVETVGLLDAGGSAGARAAVGNLAVQLIPGVAAAALGVMIGHQF